MALVNMELNQDAQGGNELVNLSQAVPKYPYGLQIALDKEQMQKLGLTIDNLKVGQRFELDGMCNVLSVSQDSADISSVRLQITEMKLDDPDDFEAGFADALGTPPVGEPW